MIRRLYLENVYGTRFHFNYQSGVLISMLSGLGFSNEYTYLKYENQYDQVERVIPLTEISAMLTFLKGYLGYKCFLDYIQQNEQNLKLHYQTIETAFCYIDIKSLSKSALIGGALQSEISFNKKSLWLKEKAISIDVNTDCFGKVFPYSYPFIYSSAYEGKVSIANKGIVKAPLKIEMYGAVDNPEVNILKNGEIVSSLKLNVSSLDCAITVSSNPTIQYMSMNEAGNITNIYQDQDFTCDNFLFLGVGEYEIEYKPGVSTLTSCRITILEGYLGN